MFVRQNVVSKQCPIAPHQTGSSDRNDGNPMTSHGISHSEYFPLMNRSIWIYVYEMGHNESTSTSGTAAELIDRFWSDCEEE